VPQHWATCCHVAAALAIHGCGTVRGQMAVHSRERVGAMGKPARLPMPSTRGPAHAPAALSTASHGKVVVGVSPPPGLPPPSACCCCCTLTPRTLDAVPASEGTESSKPTAATGSSWTSANRRCTHRRTDARAQESDRKTHTHARARGESPRERERSRHASSHRRQQQQMLRWLRQQ
jgi:hypothetical protein